MSTNPNVYAAPTAKLDSNQKQCQECNALISKKAEICPKCGVRQKGAGGAVSKVALLLITFFFGGWGLHKFYLRKPVQGVFYVLFCWTFIPGLIALVEFIVYACTSEEALNEKYQTASSGVMIAVIGVVVMFVFIAILGILAAIAIPAYQDYTYRAKIAGVMAQVEPMRAQLQERILKSGAIPASAADAPDIAPVTVPNVATATLGDHGIIVISFESTMGRQIAGNTIELEPYAENNQLYWRCTGGTLPNKFRTQNCRK
ncbi:MAG: pilin [Gammaproteobacteria bacterium]|nr:pilin [Gammaproteobacteria bacterium]